MNKREKMERALAAIEGELLELLRSRLPSVVDTGSAIFFNRRFNPHGLLQEHRHPDGDRLLKLSDEVAALRTRLELGADSGPGDMYLAACREAASVDDEHRRGPRQLASKLLADLSEQDQD